MCQIDKKFVKNARCFCSEFSTQKNATEIDATSPVTTKSIHTFKTAIASAFAARKQIWTRGIPISGYFKIYATFAYQERDRNRF